MSTGDKLIIAGVVTILAAFAVIALTITDSDYDFALVWGSLGLGAGLLTTRILMRRTR